MIALGVVLGPLTHFWYKFLDNRFPRRTKFLIVKKLLMDQLFMAPIMNITLIVGLHLLEGMAFRDLRRQFDEKFVTLYKVIAFSSYFYENQFYIFIIILYNFLVRLRSLGTSSSVQLSIYPISL